MDIKGIFLLHVMLVSLHMPRLACPMSISLSHTEYACPSVKIKQIYGHMLIGLKHAQTAGLHKCPVHCVCLNVHACSTLITTLTKRMNNGACVIE